MLDKQPVWSTTMIDQLTDEKRQWVVKALMCIHEIDPHIGACVYCKFTSEALDYIDKHFVSKMVVNA